MDRPDKPRDDFPIWPHASGSWCAVIEGKRRSFGGWAKDRDGSAALKRYHSFIDSRKAGFIMQSNSTIASVREVVNRYLNTQRRRAEGDAIAVAFPVSGFALGMRLWGNLWPRG
jgi:hypothetical protein